MSRFRCPECAAEKQLKPKFGGEIISVYCLRHAAGVDNHVRPVYMTLVLQARRGVQGAHARAGHGVGARRLEEPALKAVRAALTDAGVSIGYPKRCADPLADC